MALIEGIVLMAALLYALYKYGTRHYDHWEKKGINHTKPWGPFLGNSEDFILKRRPPGETVQKLYNSFPGQRFAGAFQFRQPVLLLRDPELIRNVTIKDFDHFVNRSGIFGTDADPLFGKSLLAMKGQQWKDMRNILSPAFTSLKMKNMFVLVNQCGEQMTEWANDQIEQQIKNSHPDQNVLTMEFQDFFRRFATDVIATSAFGVQTNSIKDLNNDFYAMANRVVKPNAFSMIKFLLYVWIPDIMKALRVSILSKDLASFFRSMVHGNIRTREEEGIVRPDLIHLLMQARKGQLTDDNDMGEKNKADITDDEITAQALLFFFAGFETASVALSFAAHEIAVNPDIQTRLQDEIDAIVKEDNGVTYDGIMLKMKYLDMVVSESLRKWSPAILVDRVVTSRYVIPKTNESPELVLEPGDTIWIPIMGLHRNPEYFPDPEKFDPQRFSEENKESMRSFTYLPFGSGPRNCIGMRFALMEVKVCLVHLLQKYSLKVVSRTQIPLRMSKTQQTQMTAEKGFWLGLKPRGE